MAILKNASKFRVLFFPPVKSVEEELTSQLLRIEKIGRTCRQSENGAANLDTAINFIRVRLIKNREENILEHSLVSVYITNVSRALAAEFMRHRHFSYNMLSSRYIDYSNPKFNLGFEFPPYKDENQPITLEDGRILTPADMVNEEESYYKALRKAGWDPEDARQYLGMGTCSTFVASANLSSWRWLFRQRAVNPKAHWSIRHLTCSILEYFKSYIPVVFEDFVLNGVDKEGISIYKIAY